MPTQGDVIRSTSGARILIEATHDSGGQGDIYLARNLTTGETGMYKEFHSGQTNPNTAKRVEYLVSQQLSNKHGAFAAPREAILQKHRIGHFSPRARGITLDQFLYDSAPLPYIQYVALALAIAGALDFLHALGWIHGDIHLGNIFVDRDPDTLVPRIWIIDFDNYRAAAVPPPPSIGHPRYLAPELRRAIQAGRPAVPDLGSEKYALGQVIQEALLLKHPAEGHFTSPEEFERVMTAGRWPDDPLSTGAHPVDQGFPPQILDSHTASLFRRAHAIDPTERPPSREWRQTLSQLAGHLHICGACRAPCIADASHRACPVCSTPFPTLSLFIPMSGLHVPLDNGCVRVGRPELGADLTVSAVHAVFRQYGPEVTLEAVGRNGVFKKVRDGSWRRIRDGEPFVVEKGDELRFGNCDVKVE